MYVECNRCGKKRCYVEENRGQGVIPDKQRWCGCQGRREEKVAWPREAKAQQSSIWSGEPESIAEEKEKEKDIRRMFKILREVWLDIGIEKVDTHKGIIVKALLDSGATRIFMDRKIAEKHGFKLRKLERLLKVKNVDRTENSGGNITYQVEVNIFYKNHVERMRMDICNLGKTKMILEMPWLQVHNPEINWEMGEVKMMRCPPLCERNLAVKEDIEQRKKIRKKIRNVEKADRDEWEWTIKEKFDEEIELDREKVKEIVP